MKKCPQKFKQLNDDGAEKGWAERDEIEILDLNLHRRMNSNVYEIEKGEFSHLENIYFGRESLVQFKQNVGKYPISVPAKLAVPMLWSPSYLI